MSILISPAFANAFFSFGMYLLSALDTSIPIASRDFQKWDFIWDCSWPLLEIHVLWAWQAYGIFLKIRGPNIGSSIVGLLV